VKTIIANSTRFGNPQSPGNASELLAVVLKQLLASLGQDAANSLGVFGVREVKEGEKGSA